MRVAGEKERFLESFRQTGRVDVSAKKARVGRSAPYRWASEDPEFLAAWDKSVEVAASVLEDEATRRAVTGVKKPVYQQCKLAGYVQEYSDTLLIFLLKGLRPEKYRELMSHEHTGKGGGPIDHMVVTFVDTPGGPGETGGGSKG